MVSVTSSSRYVTSASRYQSRSSMYTRDLIPRNYSRQFRLSSYILIIIAGAEPAGKDNNSELIRYTYFTKMKYEPVYIFGATVGNSTATAHWDIIKIRVSMGLIYAKETRFYCCIKYDNERYSITQPVITFKIRHEDERLSAAHFTCRNRRPGVVPDGVALSLYNHTCREPYVTYRRPDVPQREPGVKLAICTKLAYGSRNAEMIIEFMEVYRFLGVDKFVTYFLKDLNEDSRKVLEYYVSTGILDLYYFEPAEQGINRIFSYCKGGNFNIQIWAWFGYFIC